MGKGLSEEDMRPICSGLVPALTCPIPAWAWAFTAEDLWVGSTSMFIPANRMPTDAKLGSYALALLQRQIFCGARRSKEHAE